MIKDTVNRSTISLSDQKKYWSSSTDAKYKSMFTLMQTTR